MKNNKQLWLIVMVIAFVSSLAVSIIDLYTGAYFLESIWHRAVSTNVWQIPLPFVQAQPVAVDAILASILLVIAQFVFAREAMKTRTNKKYAFWVGAVLTAALDAYTDAHWHSGGTAPTMEQWVSSIFIFVIMSDMLFAYSTAYLFGDVMGWVMDTFDTTKENVKSALPKQKQNHNSNGNKQHNSQRQNQQPATQFALDNNTAVTLQPRQEQRPQRQREMQVNGKVMNGTAASRL